MDHVLSLVTFLFPLFALQFIDLLSDQSEFVLELSYQPESVLHYPPLVVIASYVHIGIVGRATLKMLRHKSKTQFVKQERNTQNTIAFLNYLKPIATQQLMLRTQVFTNKF
jgi:hypothetical protein